MRWSLHAILSSASQLERADGAKDVVRIGAHLEGQWETGLSVSGAMKKGLLVLRNEVVRGAHSTSTPTSTRLLRGSSWNRGWSGLVCCIDDRNVLRFVHEDSHRSTARGVGGGNRGRVPRTPTLEVRCRARAFGSGGAPPRRAGTACHCGPRRLSGPATGGSQPAKEVVSEGHGLWPETSSLTPGSSSPC